MIAAGEIVTFNRGEYEALDEVLKCTARVAVARGEAKFDGFDPEEGENIAK